MPLSALNKIKDLRNKKPTSSFIKKHPTRESVKKAREYLEEQMKISPSKKKKSKKKGILEGQGYY